MGINKKNKWINGAIPALFIHCSIGSVYAWSLFVNKISTEINASVPSVQFSFSLAIFFLGVSAAFGGGIVEKNVKHSSRISLACFVSGLILTGVSIKYKSLIGIYLSYGCLMGVGLGVGYLTPVKTLMMWFNKNKGLATGIAITGFGLASSIASPIITYLCSKFELQYVFYILGLIYFVPLFLSGFLLEKPYKDNVETQKNTFRYSAMFKDKTFLCIWFMLFINISCGLALISIGSPLMESYKIDMSIIAIVISIMGVFNGFGRIGFSTISDRFTNRSKIFIIMFCISITITGIYFFIPNKILCIIALMLISCTYGAGFSCLPALLSDKYEIQNISKIHGLSLTAWAMAGLVGNQFSAKIFTITGSYHVVFISLCVFYMIGLILSIKLHNKYNKKIN